MSPWPENGHCEQLRLSIESFLDGDLPAGEQELLKAHLDGCPQCASQVQLARELQKELRALPEFDTPAPLLHQIFDQTVRHQEPPAAPDRSWRLWPRPVWAALAAAALVLALGVAMLDRSAPDRESPDAVAIAQATAEARYALAKTGLFTRKAGQTIRDRALRDQIAVPTSQGLSQVLGSPDSTNGAAGVVHEGVNDV